MLPPNKNPGGGQAISGAEDNVIYPEVFQQVNSNNRLLDGLLYLKIWDEAVERRAYFLAALRLLNKGDIYAE